MGRTASKPLLLSEVNGDAKLFKDRFVIDHKLGEGEFGIVHLIREKSSPISLVSSPSEDSSHKTPLLLACKQLQKGVVFRDNTLYTPLKPEVLRRECNILRALQGQHYTLVLHALFESKSMIYIVTEYCAGGMMMDYLHNCYATTGLSTMDISRIYFQLLDAVAHCEICGVIHRDIKPENIMFTSSQPGADLRLIDFGCGAFNTEPIKITSCIHQVDGSLLHRHSTYVGTPFYASPELFQRNYSQRTDVWSAGVTMYVLVAGYPSDKLQKAFDMLQKNHLPTGGRQDFLKSLPHMPSTVPDSYFDVLDMCLVTNHKNRKSAKEILPSEFVQFHKVMASTESNINNKATTTTTTTSQKVGLTLESIVAEANVNISSTTVIPRSESTTQLYIIEQTAHRHTTYIQYGKFERSVVALLAAVLDQDKLKLLILSLEALLQDHLTDEKLQQRSPSDHQLLANKRRLQVVKVSELKAALKVLELENIVPMIENLPSYQESFDIYAFHFKLLNQFVRDSYKQLSVHKQQERTKSGEKHGNPLDISVHHKDDSTSTSTSKKDSSVSRKLRRIAQTILVGKKKPGEVCMNPLDVSVHIPRDDSHKGMTVHGTQIWNQLKKGSNLDLSSSDLGNTSSLRKAKRFSSMLNLQQLDQPEK